MNDKTKQELAQLRNELANIESKRQQLLQRISAVEVEVERSHSDNRHKNTTDITNLSPTQDEIKLYHCLFRGREDVYSRRFESTKTGKSGYQPACKNEWVKGICGKPQVKCSNCNSREYLPLTDKTIEWHLRGENPDEYGSKDFTIGTYPMLPDEKCWFLAADFDKSSWQEDIKAFVKTCFRMDVPVSVERSRSGNGGHVWLFFEEPIPCMKARAIGSYLITLANSLWEISSELDFWHSVPGMTPSALN